MKIKTVGDVIRFIRYNRLPDQCKIHFIDIDTECYNDTELLPDDGVHGIGITNYPEQIERSNNE